jgi:hypothetical protein
MTDDDLRQQYPIQGAAFDQLRRAGVERANGAVIEVNGTKYRVLVDRPATLDVHHLTLQCLDAPRHKVSMVALLWARRVPYGAGVDGTGLLMKAWTEGLAVEPAGSPSFHTWRVLPFVAVPRSPARPRRQRTTQVDTKE